MANAPKHLDSAYGAPLQRWDPKYDHVIALHISGLDIEPIAEIVGFSPGHVRRILKDPRVVKAVDVLRKKMMGRVLTDVSERMTALAPKALENIQKTIEEDFAPGSKGKKHQDNVSFELLARVGYGRKDTSQEEDLGNKLPKELAEKLVKAIDRAEKAREISELPELEATVIDSSS